MIPFGVKTHGRRVAPAQGQWHHLQPLFAAVRTTQMQVDLPGLGVLGEVEFNMTSLGPAEGHHHPHRLRADSLQTEVFRPVKVNIFALPCFTLISFTRIFPGQLNRGARPIAKWHGESQMSNSIGLERRLS